MFGARIAPAVLLTAALVASQATVAAEVAGVRIEERLRAGGGELVLNGAGVRTRLFFKVYVAALYVPRRSTAAPSLIDSREARRINLHLLRDLEADSLVSALKEGLKQNHSDAELGALVAELGQFEALMRAVGNGRSGDVITIDFTADGCAVSFNGQARGSVPGEAFARALLKVWLGDRPVDGDLKQALLGG